MGYQQHLKLGDYLTLLLGALCISFMITTFWSGGAADKAIIRSGGKIFRVVSLAQNLEINVPGPLGISLITIRDHQARIMIDPSPRQYCVRQGWLKSVGEIAICLPNQVSVELTGSQRKYDSLSY